MAMAEEIELKLALAESHQSRFSAPPLAEAGVQRHVETLDNIYYDTSGPFPASQGYLPAPAPQRARVAANGQTCG